MITQLAKWGNSVALRIPSAYARDLNVSERCNVDVTIVSGALVVRPVEVDQKYDLSELVSGITEENLHDEIGTGNAVGGEFA